MGEKPATGGQETRGGGVTERGRRATPHLDVECPPLGRVMEGSWGAGHKPAPQRASETPGGAHGQPPTPAVFLLNH